MLRYSLTVIYPPSKKNANFGKLKKPEQLRVKCLYCSFIPKQSYSDALEMVVKKNLIQEIFLHKNTKKFNLSPKQFFLCLKNKTVDKANCYTPLNPKSCSKVITSYTLHEARGDWVRFIRFNIVNYVICCSL